MARPPVRFGLWYDFRNPAPWRKSSERLYEETLEQVVWAESLGLRSAWLTEHHFCDDGYTPSPLVLAAAIGARTSEMAIGTNLMLLPLHDPVRLAEDAATLSILTKGRFDLGVAIGYRQVEFDAFGRRLEHRPSLLEEGVEVIRRAWAGRPVAFEGKRFRVPDVRVTPVPEHPPGLFVGGMTEPAIDRVARIADGFLSTQNAHHELYLEGLRKAGKDPASGRIFAGQWAVVDEDPERTWARIGDHAVYQLNEYIGWGAFGPPDQVPRFEDRDQVVAAGVYQLWDADRAVRELAALLAERPQIEDVHFWAQLPGEPVESGSRRVEYLATKVVPEVLGRLAGPPPATAPPRASS